MTAVSFLRTLCETPGIKQERSCVRIAEQLCDAIVKEFPNCPVSMLCIKSVGNPFIHPLTIKTSIGNRFSYPAHFVVAVEGKVFDPIHGYIAEPVSKYFKTAVIPETGDFRLDYSQCVGVELVEPLFDAEVQSHYVVKRAVISYGNGEQVGKF